MSLEAIEALRRELSRRVAEVFDAAYAVDEPAGSSPAWDAICARYEVERLADADRPAVLAAQRPTRGAPVMEVHGAAVALPVDVRRQLKKIDAFDAPRPVERAHEGLMRFIGEVPLEVVAAYKKAVLPARKGMFANVLAHHDDGKKSSMAGGVAHALRCTTCGAPRIRDGFDCPFCGNEMVKTK